MRPTGNIICGCTVGRGVKEDLAQEAGRLLSKVGKKDKNKDKDKDDLLTQIIFYSRSDLAVLTDMMAEQLKKCATVEDVRKIDVSAMMKKSALNRPINLDIALWGRMVTSDAFRNVEASMKVAHAISTNRIAMESDYFTAIDDLVFGDEPRCGHLEDRDYNSACYYMYASLDTKKLKDNLGEGNEDLAKVAVNAWIRAMAFTNPSGMQNSFAGNVLPSAILIECKEQNVPVSLVSAFEVPAAANSHGSLVHNSASKLMEMCASMQKKYGLPVKARYWFSMDDTLRMGDDLGSNCETFPELLAGVKNAMEGEM